MNDLISRQAAIDAMQKAVKNIDSMNKADIVAVISNLPSVQQWIPCSERLPEDSGWYIVTKELDYDTTFVGLEWYDSANGWKYDNAKCIAWMPLPEPYKGEQE